MATKFKIGDIVYVEIRSASNAELLYKGKATVEKLRGGKRNSVVVKGDLDTEARFVYTNGTDGDVIRYPTKLDKYLWGEK